MRGWIGGIQRFSTEDGPGIRTTLFLKGCPLSCGWCHNPELMGGGRDILFSPGRCIGCGDCAGACPRAAMSMSPGGPVMDRAACGRCGSCAEACPSGALRSSGHMMTVDEAVAAAERDRSFYESTGGGVTLSGGEVLSNAPFAAAIAAACRSAGLAVAIETSGFGGFRQLRGLAEGCDCLLYDIKMMDGARHALFTGADNKKILDNLEALCREDSLRRKITVRMPLVAGVNDSEGDIQAAAEFMSRNGLFFAEFLPYHEMGVSKSRELGAPQRRFEPPTDERLQALVNVMKRTGCQARVLGWPDSRNS